LYGYLYSPGLRGASIKRLSIDPQIKSVHSGYRDQSIGIKSNAKGPSLDYLHKILSSERENKKYFRAK